MRQPHKTIWDNIRCSQNEHEKRGNFREKIGNGEIRFLNRNQKNSESRGLWKM